MERTASLPPSVLATLQRLHASLTTMGANFSGHLQQYRREFEAALLDSMPLYHPFPPDSDDRDRMRWAGDERDNCRLLKALVIEGFQKGGR